MRRWWFRECPFGQPQARKIRHHSISRARVERFTGTLTAAKRFATREFGGGFSGHQIVIFDRDGDLVARKTLHNGKWTDGRE